MVIERMHRLDHNCPKQHALLTKEPCLVLREPPLRLTNHGHLWTIQCRIQFIRAEAGSNLVFDTVFISLQYFRSSRSLLDLLPITKFEPITKRWVATKWKYMKFSQLKMEQETSIPTNCRPNCSPKAMEKWSNQFGTIWKFGGNSFGRLRRATHSGQKIH